MYDWALENSYYTLYSIALYRVGQKSDTSRALHYIVREVSLFWPTLYVDSQRQRPLLFAATYGKRN